MQPIKQDPKPVQIKPDTGNKTALERFVRVCTPAELKRATNDKGPK